MSQKDHRAAGAPARRGRHASARRGPGTRWALAGGGVVGLGLLAVVVAGAFRTGETGGPGEDGDHPGLPALIQADPPAEGESGDGGEATGAPKPGASSGTAAASAGPGAGTPSGSPTASLTAAPTAGGDGAVGSGDGSGGDSADGTGQQPGKSGSAPGATKRPR